MRKKTPALTMARTEPLGPAYLFLVVDEKGILWSVYGSRFNGSDNIQFLMYKNDRWTYEDASQYKPYGGFVSM